MEDERIPPGHPDDLPAITATLASYQDLLGSYHPHTVAMGALLGATLWRHGQRALGRQILKRAVEDAMRLKAGHPVQARVWVTLSALLQEDRERSTIA